MDITSSSSDSYQSGWIDLTATPAFSISQPRQASHSDRDIILASNRPKKRAGRTKFKETRHPIYRGVRSRNTDRWVCELREPVNQTRIWLGTYPTAEMAARAHDVAALALRGQSACLNFADSVWRLPVPPSNDAKDLRKTAMEAAEAFRPSGSGVNSGSGGNSGSGMDSGSGGDSRSGEGRRDYVQAFDRASSSEEAMVGMMNTTPETVNYNDEATMGMMNTTPETDYFKDEAMMGMFNNTTQETGYFNDEEAMLDMPWLMQDMAEGMMLPPPPCSNGESSWHYEETTDTELPLWSYSF